MFVTVAQNYLQTLPTSSFQHRALSYMLENAVGQENAIRKSELCEVLGTSEYYLETHFIIPCRRNFSFIGISRFHGIFIIEDEEDARITVEYYTTQISGVDTHLQHLIRRCQEYNFQIDIENYLAH